MEICSDVRRSMSRVRGLHFAAWSIYHLHRHSKLKYFAKPFVFGLSIFTSKSSFVREYLILYKSALTLWTTLVTYSKSHSHDDFLQSDSLLFGWAHVNFGTLLKKDFGPFWRQKMWSIIAVDAKRRVSNASSSLYGIIRIDLGDTSFPEPFLVTNRDESITKNSEWPLKLKGTKWKENGLTVLYQHKHRIDVHSNGIHHQFQRIVCIEPELPKVQN